jgi:hypothetical protein
MFCFSNVNDYTQRDFILLHGAQSFWKHNFRSSNHKIFYVLSKSKVHHHMILSIPGPHSEPLESSPHFQKVFKIPFNFILPSTYRLSKWSLAFSLPEFCMLFSFKHLCYAVRYLIFVCLISATTFEKECKFKKICRFTIFNFFLFLTDPSNLLDTLFSDTVNHFERTICLYIYLLLLPLAL